MTEVVDHQVDRVQRVDLRGSPPSASMASRIAAMATAVFYRLPIPMQPMKVVAAMIIVGALTPAQSAAAGLLLGTLLLLLTLSGVIGRIAGSIPASVILGVQLAVGIHLAWLGLVQVIGAPIWDSAH